MRLTSRGYNLVVMKQLCLATVLLCTLLSSGCAPDAGTGTAADTAPGATATAEPTEPTSFPMAIVDWADIVKFKGITYLSASEAGGVGRPLKKEDLGPKFAEVRHKLQDNVNDPAYETKNGDAGFLEAGTAVYEVKGYDPSFRLAAYNDIYEGKNPTLYEVMSNPRADEPSDYLDIEGKVRYIGIEAEVRFIEPRRGRGRVELAAIRDRREVRSLVSMIMEAPLEAEPGSVDDNGRVYFLVFHLEDGTATTQTYYADEGKLYFGVTLPEEFRRASAGSKTEQHKTFDA